MSIDQAQLDSLTNSYADLLIVQYVTEPKARQTIRDMVEPIVALALINTQMMSGYSPASAVGAQLDILAKWVGVYSPLPGQPGRVQLDFTGPVTLTDAQLRQLISLKIVQNSSRNDLASIQSLIQTFFPGTIQVFDHRNMTMGYYFDATFGSQQLAEIVVKGGFLPKPLGVRLNCLIYSVDVLTTGFFGVHNYGEAQPALVVGLRNYGTDPTGRMLTYMEAIST